MAPPQAPTSRRALLRGLVGLAGAAAFPDLAWAAAFGDAPGCAEAPYLPGSLPWGCAAIPQPLAAVLGKLPDAAAAIAGELGVEVKARDRFLKLCAKGAKGAAASVAPFTVPHVGVAACLFGRASGWTAIMLGGEDAWEVGMPVVTGTDWLGRYWIDGKPDRAERFLRRTVPVGPGVRRSWPTRCGATVAGMVHPTRAGEVLVGDEPVTGKGGTGRVVAQRTSEIDGGEVVAVLALGLQ